MYKSISVLYNNQVFTKVNVLRNGEVLLLEDLEELKIEKIHRDRYYFLKAVSDLQASEYVKLANLEENGAAIIKFDACKEKTDRIYRKYFADMHKISRLLFDNIIFMYKVLPFVNTITITVPYGKYELVVEADRDTLELFVNKQRSIEQQQQNHFDLTEFIQQFVKVKK